MVNTADKDLRLVDISLVAIYFRELCFVGPSQVWTALEPDIASETAVLLSRPPQPLLEHPSKRTTFYVLLSRRKLSKCV